MTRKEIQEEIKKGNIISKQAYTKWKGNKIIRGSFYDYYCGNVKITEAQFDHFRDELELIPENIIGVKRYKLREP